MANEPAAPGVLNVAFDTAPTLAPVDPPAPHVAPQAPPPNAGGEDFADLPAEVSFEDQDVYENGRTFEEILGAPEPVAAPAIPAVAAPAVQPQAPAVPAQAAPAQPVAPVPAQPQVAAPPVAPQPGQVPAAPVAQPPVPAAQPAEALARLDEQLDKSRDVVVSALTSHYESTFTDADIEELHTEPKKFMAKTAAKLHVDALQNMTKVISANLPAMVAGIMTAQRTQQDASDAFWRENPGLNRAQHEGLVRSLAVTHRQMNPNMPVDEFKRTLAAMAMATAGVAPQVAQPAAPQPPAVRMPRGFQPAGAGQVHPAPAPTSPANGNWGAIMEQMLQE